MKPTKLKDCETRGIFFLRNFKKYKFIHAYQKTEYEIDGKILCCRYKDCGQRLINPEDVVYTINGK